MEPRYKYIILALAILIACLIFISGIRKLSVIPLKKKSYFVTSLLLVLALFGCNFNISGGNDLNKDPMDNIINKGDSKRIKELNKTQEWKEFKAFWKDLDNVKPGKDARIDGFMYAYREGEDYEKKNKLVEKLRKKNKDLKDSLDILVKKGLLHPLEPTFLYEICNSRIQYIYYGKTSMMTRMMPSPGVIEKETTMAMLEFKIDTLLNMEKKGKIDTAELKLAMDNILQEIKKANILNIFDYHKMLFYLPSPFLNEQSEKHDTIAVVDRTILDFNNSYKEFMKKYNASKADKSQKEMYERYEAIKKELDTYSEIYPQFSELIKDLVGNV